MRSGTSPSCWESSGCCSPSPRLPGCSPTTDAPLGGGRFALSRPDGSPDVVLKTGDPVALRREARGARIAGPPLAPRIIRSGAGILASQWVDGHPVPFADLDPSSARALGGVLRRVHDRRRAATAGLPGWASRARDLRGYARRRGADAMVHARTAAERSVVADAAAIAARACPAEGRFAFLHGDLVAGNVVWGPSGPVLVDWEFWRMGDPAEDLAYLEALGNVPRDVSGAVRAGYGASRALGTRIDAWRALALVDAALWHRAHGDAATGRDLLRRAHREARA